MTRPKPIAEVAEETRDALIRHIESNSPEDDARREAERDARVKSVLEELAAAGMLPPKMTTPPR